MKCLQLFFWGFKNSDKKLQSNNYGQLMLCGQFSVSTYVQILVSDQTVVRPLSRHSCDLWSDYSATLPSDQSVVRPLSRLSCDLWSDFSATLPSDQTVERPLSRPSCDSSVSQNMYLGRTTSPVCDPNGLVRAVQGRAPKTGLQKSEGLNIVEELYWEWPQHNA